MVTTDEHSLVNLNLSQTLAHTDDSFTSLTLAGLPAGGTFYSDASEQHAIGTYANGTWTFSATEVGQANAAGHGFYFLAPAGVNDYTTAGGTAGWSVVATVTDQETDSDTGIVSHASTVSNLTLHLSGPTVTDSAASGLENTAIALNITPHISDFNGAEGLTQGAITISGLPTGALLNHGVHNADGSWTLQSGDLTGLTVTPPTDNAANFTLTVTSSATDSAGNTLTSTAVPLAVTVTGQVYAAVQNVAA